MQWLWEMQDNNLRAIDLAWMQLGEGSPCMVPYSNRISPWITEFGPLLWQAKQTVSGLCKLQNHIGWQNSVNPGQILLVYGKYSLYYVIKIASKRKEVSNFPKPACALYQCPRTLLSIIIDYSITLSSRGNGQEGSPRRLDWKFKKQSLFCFLSHYLRVSPGIYGHF